MPGHFNASRVGRFGLRNVGRRTISRVGRDLCKVCLMAVTLGDDVGVCVCLVAGSRSAITVWGGGVSLEGRTGRIHPRVGDPTIGP